MEDIIIHIIAFISLSWYGCNTLLDTMYDRPLSGHTGYGVIAIISSWQIVPALAIGTLIVFTLHQIMIFICYLDIMRSKAESYKK